MNITNSQIKKQARMSLKGNWGLVVLLTFIVFLLNLLLPIIFDVNLSGGFSAWIDSNESISGGNFISNIISFVLIPFSVAINWFYLSLERRESPHISQVFLVYKNGKQSLKLVGTSLLIGLFTMLWSLLFLIPGFIKSLSYSQTFFLLKDHPEYTVTQAITQSRIRMKGFKWKYFLLGLSFIGWGILCILTLGIGLLWLVPYITASLATFYNEVIASQDPDNTEKKEIIL
jgi:uncharacterized membrane protein